MNKVFCENLNPLEEIIDDNKCSNYDFENDETEACYDNWIINKFENNKGLKYDKIYPSLFDEIKENIFYIDIIAGILEDLVSSNLGKVNLINIFNSNKVPSISLKNYLYRFYKFSKCSFESYIVWLIYIDRLCEKRVDFKINQINCHKLILTAFSLGSKFNDDLRLNNKDFCKIGGVKAIDLNNLEWEFLNLIEYDLDIDNGTFFNYLCEIFLNGK